MEDNITKISYRRKAINSICIFNLNKNWIAAQFCACFVPEALLWMSANIRAFYIGRNVGQIGNYGSEKHIRNVRLKFYSYVLKQRIKYRRETPSVTQVWIIETSHKTPLDLLT